MKLLATVALWACISACSSVGPADSLITEARENRFAVYLGQRNLDEDDYAPVDEQTTLGVEFSKETSEDPLGFELGLMASEDSARIFGFGTEGSTRELYGGIRKTFGSDVLRPYVGAGVSFINSKFEVDGVGEDDDSSQGAYVHGGLALQAGESLLFGLDLRFLFGTSMTIAGVDTDADYGQVAMFLGFQF